MMYSLYKSFHHHFIFVVTAANGITKINGSSIKIWKETQEGSVVPFAASKNKLFENILFFNVLQVIVFDNVINGVTGIEAKFSKKTNQVYLARKQKQKQWHSNRYAFYLIICKYYVVNRH